jgi:gliding motility-associated-like protein
LNIKNITAFCNKDSLIQITICNNGTKAFKESIPISFYDKNPEITKANVIKKGKIAVELAINECKTYNIKAPILPNQKIYIAINDLAQTPTPFNLKNAVLNQVSAECVFTNNIDSFSLQAGNKTLDLGADKVICNSQIIVLNAKKGYVSYIWQDGSKDSTFTAFYPGKYWVKVKDECGLEQIDTIEIKLNTLKVELGNNRIICEGENITLSPNADFDQYFWSSNQNPIACNNCKSINEKPNKKTTYYIVVTKNGCISNDSVTITPILFKPNIGKDTSICAAQKIVLKSNIKSDINAWKSIKGNNTICTNCDSIILNPLQNTKIIFEASLGNCKNTDTIEIRIKVEKIDLGKDTEICLGDSLLLNASGFSNISWSSNPNQVLCISCDNLLVSPKIVTQYYVKAEKNNCIASDSILITPIIIDLKLARDTSLCKGDTLKLFASGKFDSYVWKKNNSIINCNNCPTLKFVGEDKAQDIQLQVTKGKCKASAHTFVNLEDEIICLTCRAGKVYLPNIFSPNDDGINDEFYPQSSDCESSVNIFQIFDRWGVLVFEEKNFPLNDSKFAWKGDFKKQEAQIGIYAYYLELQQKSGKITTQKGDVMLIR